jgi:hypothetical protein
MQQDSPRPIINHQHKYEERGQESERKQKIRSQAQTGRSCKGEDTHYFKKEDAAANQAEETSIDTQSQIEIPVGTSDSGVNQ